MSRQIVRRSGPPRTTQLTGLCQTWQTRAWTHGLTPRLVASRRRVPSPAVHEAACPSWLGADPARHPHRAWPALANPVCRLDPVSHLAHPVPLAHPDRATCRAWHPARPDPPDRPPDLLTFQRQDVRVPYPARYPAGGHLRSRHLRSASSAPAPPRWRRVASAAGFVAHCAPYPGHRRARHATRCAPSCRSLAAARCHASRADAARVRAHQGRPPRRAANQPAPSGLKPVLDRVLPSAPCADWSAGRCRQSGCESGD